MHDTVPASVRMTFQGITKHFPGPFWRLFLPAELYFSDINYLLYIFVLVGFVCCQMSMG